MVSMSACLSGGSECSQKPLRKNHIKATEDREIPYMLSLWICSLSKGVQITRSKDITSLQDVRCDEVITSETLFRKGASMNLPTAVEIPRILQAHSTTTHHTLSRLPIAILCPPSSVSESFLLCCVLQTFACGFPREPAGYYSSMVVRNH